MWIARTSEYNWILSSSGNFCRSDRSGNIWSQNRPCVSPTWDDKVQLLNGVDDYGEEVIIYIRISNSLVNAYNAFYEVYKCSTGCWYTICSNDAFKWTNLARIRETQKRLAEEILLGQT